MTNTSDIINKVGSAAIEVACNVGEHSVRAAKRDGKFPASWFDEMEKLCADHGLPCPRNLFAFKRPQEDSPASDYRLGGLAEGAL